MAAHPGLVGTRREADGAVRAWSSAEGKSWTRVSGDGRVDGYIVDAAGTDPIVLIVGFQSIWTAEN